MYLEDKKSIELMNYNETLINGNEIGRKKDRKLILNYFRRVFKYVCMGQFGYAWYAIKRAFMATINKEKKTEAAPRTRVVEKDERIAVYTVLFGAYDNLKNPLFISEQCDYYVLTNQKVSDELVWKKYDISKFKETENFSNLEKARYFKLHPHKLFPEYKYSIFIDANIQIVTELVPVVEQLGDNFIGIHNQPGRDCVYQEATEILVINKAPREQVIPQINAYKKEGFPKHYGLFRTCVVVREHMHPLCIKLMNIWWENIEKYSKRDQLSFTYALWKIGLTKSDVSNLGDDVRTNPRFKESLHS